MKKSGFTLSEVLLTLAIIGVVAAMTVPSLMSSTEEKKLAAGAKKAYNTIQNAISMKYAADEVAPEDYAGSNIVTLLTGGVDGAGESVLKIVDADADAAPTIVELPDGQIMIGSAIAAGGVATITVDVNGSATPNRSGVAAQATDNNKDVELMTAVAAARADENRADRDKVIFQINNLDVVPLDGDFYTKLYIDGVRPQ